jgi:hypothetical protein
VSAIHQHESVLWTAIPIGLSDVERMVLRANDPYDELRTWLASTGPFTSVALQMIICSYINETEIRVATEAYRKESIVAAKAAKTAAVAAAKTKGKSGRGGAHGQNKKGKQAKPSIVRRS